MDNNEADDWCEYKVCKMATPRHNLSTEELVNQLMFAIRNGDQASARESASKLASRPRELKIEVVPKDNAAEDKENSFK